MSPNVRPGHWLGSFSLSSCTKYGSSNLLAPSSYSNLLSYRSREWLLKISRTTTTGYSWLLLFYNRHLFACVGRQACFANQCNAHARKWRHVLVNMKRPITGCFLTHTHTHTPFSIDYVRNYINSQFYFILFWTVNIINVNCNISTWTTRKYRQNTYIFINDFLVWIVPQTVKRPVRSIKPRKVVCLTFTFRWNRNSERRAGLF